MFKFIRKKMNKKGFTLVELLVVIAVLGIIAGIAIPRMSGVTDGFRQKADLETARNLNRQVQIKIQMGDIVPTTALTTVQFAVAPNGHEPAADTDQYFGETFTDNPQTAAGGTFLIQINETQTIISAVTPASEGTAAQTVEIETYTNTTIIQ